jgi:F0F1-type ATP synthase epsilon subunit
MEQTFKLTIRTTDGDFYLGEVKSLQLSSEGGDMQIYSNHASVTASFLFSPLVVEEAGGLTEAYVLRNGVFSFDNDNNKALIMALHAEKKSEVSEKTVMEYLAYIEEQLASGADLSDFQVLYLKGQKLAVQKQVGEVV